MKKLMVVFACFSAATVLAGLAPNALEPLPLGAIRPEGWLKFQLNLMTEGQVGRLYETSEFLTPTNGWLKADGIGWEEQPYWLRSFAKLAVLTGNERCLAVSGNWFEKILATRDQDGWFGPQDLKAHRFSNGMKLNDIWGHMVMAEALWSWWEYTLDRRIVELLSAFVGYLAKVPDAELIAPPMSAPWEVCNDWHWHYGVQRGRSGDMLPVLYRLYGLTGDEQVLKLSHRLMAKCRRSDLLWVSNHNVTFAQCFRYWTVYSRLTGNAADRASADYWFDQHMATWGQMPRCAFAADENVRNGYTDPRQATESCTWGEFMRSFNVVGDFFGATKWADRIEDVVFNHAPCAYTPDWKEVHYLTAPNQVNLDARTDHNYDNMAPMIAYSSTDYRCCRHNAALTFPLFTENLVKRGADGALVFWVYAPHSGRVDLGGNEVRWRFDTRYPFRETADLTIETAKPLKLRFRVPGWCRDFRVGGSRADAGAAWAHADVPAGKTMLKLAMKAECAYTFWPRSGGVTVDRGALSYSLAIGEKYVKARHPGWKGGSLVWSEETAKARPRAFMTEVTATTPWNYALEVKAPLEYRSCAWTDDCFVSTNAVCEIFATGRRLPEWTLQDNEPAELQRSPAYTTAKIERLRFVPLCCQRCRLSVLPQATDDTAVGVRWKVTPATTKRADRKRWW